MNTASRMESNGRPGCIQVTHETARRLGDRYAFERRGVIDVKGKGEVEAYFLRSRLPDPAATGPARRPRG